MPTYRLDITYDGARYKGWQRLGHTDMTIQGKIELAIITLADERVEVPGASRTDAGVHAYNQVAHFHCKEQLTSKSVQRHLNQYLPEDIRITRVKQVDDKFHSRYNAKGKTYRYQVWNASYVDPFQRKTHVLETRKMDDEAMKEAAQLFVGEHDFTTFTTAKSKKKSMVRKVESIEIIRQGTKLYIDIKGEGFLHNQVRRMVGVLLEIGAGERKVESVTEMIAAKDRSKCGVTADPKGLFLKEVHY